jgi:prepilin-type N-terminal cleavage/methylation domain-containing protein
MRYVSRKGAKTKGFTLVELVIVMSVISIILSYVVPSLKGLQDEAELTKAEGELNTIKTAVISYWRNYDNVFPVNITAALTKATPNIIEAPLTDPFETDMTNNTYGYIEGTDADFGIYFIAYSRGPKHDSVPVWNTTHNNVTFTGSGAVVSNAPVIKQ